MLYEYSYSFCVVFFVQTTISYCWCSHYIGYCLSRCLHAYICNMSRRVSTRAGANRHLSVVAYSAHVMSGLHVDGFHVSSPAKDTNFSSKEFAGRVTSSTDVSISTRYSSCQVRQSRQQSIYTWYQVPTSSMSCVSSGSSTYSCTPV